MHFRGKFLPFDVKIKTPKAFVLKDFRAFIKVCRKLPAAGLELIRASLKAFIYKGFAKFRVQSVCKIFSRGNCL